MTLLVLKYNVGPDGAVHLQPEVRKQDGQAALLEHYPACCSYAEVTRWSQQTIETLNRARKAMGRCLEASDWDAASQYCGGTLREWGRGLSQRLLPPGVARRLLDDRSITHLDFQCDPLLNGVPFDICFLGGEFIGFRYATARQLLNPHLRRIERRPGPTPYRGYSVVDPGEQLAPEVARIFLQFKQGWAQGLANTRIDFTRATVSIGMPKGRLAHLLRGQDFFNLICHHNYESERPAETGLVLAPGAIFSAKDFLEAIRESDLPPTLVFSVSCESGITEGWEKEWPKSGKMYGLVDAALRAGVRHYIGTLIEIPAVRSVSVLQPFYEALAGGFTVAESFRRARLALRRNPLDASDGGTVLGLAFILYGDPAKVYLCGNGHRADTHAAVLCEAQANDGLCLKGVCSQDEGFSAKRCSEHFQPPIAVCSAGHSVAGTHQLRPCGREGCHNMVCSRCSGHSRRICWEHCCAEGHEIAEPHKTCPDPRGLHPLEKRAVCCRDRGWIRGWCAECHHLSQNRQAL